MGDVRLSRAALFLLALLLTLGASTSGQSPDESTGSSLAESSNVLVPVASQHVEGLLAIAGMEGGKGLVALTPEELIVFRVEHSPGRNPSLVEASSTRLQPGLRALMAAPQDSRSGTAVWSVHAASDSSYVYNGNHGKAWRLLVDEEGRPDWRLIEIPTKFSSLIAVAGGVLVDDTQHLSALLAHFSEDGELVRRFGRPLKATTSLHATYEHQVILGRGRDSEIVVAGRYLPALRGYDPATYALLWEVEPKLEVVASRNDSRAAIAASVSKTETCVSCTLVRYFDSYALVDDEYLGFHLSQTESLLIATSNGGQRRSVSMFAPIEQVLDETTSGIAAPADFDSALPAIHPVTNSKGMTWTDAGLAVGTQDQISIWTVGQPFRIEATLLGDSEPRTEARVHWAIRSETGTSIPDAQGSFSIEIADRSDLVDLELVAPGFFSLDLMGARVSEISGQLFNLLPAPELCLEITDSEGSAVPDALLRLHEYRELSPGSIRTSSLGEWRLAEGGALCLNPPKAPPWRADVTAPGFALKRDVIQDFGNAQVTLSPGGDLRVSVLNSKSEEPIEGATLWMADSDTPFNSRRLSGSLSEIGTAQTDVEGDALFKGLAAGRYRLTVNRQGFATQSVTVDIDGPDTDAEVYLLGGAPVSFSILDRATREPLSGARISANLLADRGSAPLSCTSSNNGMCDLGEVSPGLLNYKVQQEGFAQHFGRVEIAVDGRSLSTQVEMNRGTRVTGLLDSCQTYAPQKLLVYALVGGSGRRQASVHDDCSFGFEQLSTGVALVEVRTPNGLLFHRSSESVSDEEWLLDLGDAVFLEGRVEDGAGGACPSCIVSLSSLELPNPGRRSASWSRKTTVDGQFGYLVPTGEYDVSARHPDGRTARERVRAGAGERVVLELSGASLKVEVRKDGQLLPASVTILDAQGRARSEVGDSGVVHFLGLRAGHYSVSAQDGGGNTGSSEIDLGQTESGAVEVFLERRAASVLVTDASSGQPIKHKVARVAASGANFAARGLELVLGDDGLAEVPLPGPEGPWTIAIQVDGYSGEQVEVASSSAAKGLRVALHSFPLPLTIYFSEPPSICAVAVYDSQGRMMPQTELQAPAQVTTAGRSSVIFTGLPAGRYTAIAATCEGENRQGDVALARGAFSTNTLTF